MKMVISTKKMVISKEILKSTYISIFCIFNSKEKELIGPDDVGGACPESTAPLDINDRTECCCMDPNVLEDCCWNKCILESMYESFTKS